MHILEELSTRWGRHIIMNKWMHRFFMYLDRYHVQHHALPSLREAGVAAFRNCVFVHVQPSVTSAMLEAIDRDR